MKLFGREVEGNAKVLVILVALLLVASGLCGVQVAILHSRRNGVENLDIVFAITGILELGVVLLSLAGIVGVSMAWAISHFFWKDGRAQKDTSQPIFHVTSQGDERDERSHGDAQDGE